MIGTIWTILTILTIATFVTISTHSYQTIGSTPKNPVIAAPSCHWDFTLIRLSIVFHCAYTVEIYPVVISGLCELLGYQQRLWSLTSTKQGKARPPLSRIAADCIKWLEGRNNIDDCADFHNCKQSWQLWQESHLLWTVHVFPFFTRFWNCFSHWFAWAASLPAKVVVSNFNKTR